MGTIVTPSEIEITFEDDYTLHGFGHIEVEKGALFGVGSQTVERGDLMYLTLETQGFLRNRLAQVDVPVDPGDYVVCRGGLYERVLP